MKFSFNTGRQYTEAGQIIHVEVSDGRAWFHDESRGIAGSVQYGRPQTWPFLSSGSIVQREAQDVVMEAYDNGSYRQEQLPAKGEARNRA